MTNGWHGIGPYLAKERLTVHNRWLASGRALTRHDAVTEKDRGSGWFNDRTGSGGRNGEIRRRPQSRKGAGDEDY